MIGRENGLAAACVTVSVDDSRHQGHCWLAGSVMLARGQSANYRFDGYDNSVGAWIWIEVGSSSGLDVSGLEPNDVPLEYSESGDTLRDSGDITEFFTLDLGDEELPTVAIDEAGFGMCPLAQQASDGETAMVGYARLEGG